MSNPPVTEGFAPFTYPAAGKPLTTWYKITGTLSPAGPAPLIILHGGPGVGSSAYSPLADLTVAHGIPIIQYDQIGCGRSSHLQKKSTSGAEFWNEQLFIRELEGLIEFLGLVEYDILGHSWGAMFGSRFATTRPKGLRRLIIMSSSPSMALWSDAQSLLRSTLPQEIQDTLTRCEEAGTTHSGEYQAAMGAYYGRFLCRLNPMPEEILASFALLAKDPTVYSAMWGKPGFKATGPIKDMTVLDDLHKINVPVLLLNGRYDQAQDSAMVQFFNRIPKVKWVQFAESAHMAQWEERERFMQVVGGWLMSEL